MIWTLILIGLGLVLMDCTLWAHEGPHALPWGRALSSHERETEEMKRRYQIQRANERADEELYAVAPELAVELGYVPPEERIQVCLYCDEQVKAKDMLAHQQTCELAKKHAEQMQKAQEAEIRRAKQRQNAQLQSLNQRMMGLDALTQHEGMLRLQQQKLAAQRRWADQRGLMPPPGSRDLLGGFDPRNFFGF